jgi:putative FmdB family regulatory protein
VRLRKSIFLIPFSLCALASLRETFSMPLFEYRCQECQKRFTFLAGVIADNFDPACPRCGSMQLKKLISRVARGRSDDDRMDALADRLESADMDDPRDLRRFAREMGREMGQETGEDLSDEMEELIEAEARGEEGSALGGGGDDGTIY